MYKVPTMAKSQMTSCEVVEGETIEQKIERIVSNKEPIKDGSPEIFTERKDGVIAAYNIRTDRWEIAAEAMDAVSRSIQAKREERMKLGNDKESELVSGEKVPKGDVGETKTAPKGDVGGTKTVQGDKGAS